jgi:predicted NBD/HSP70 family sugar kinase
MMRLQPDRLVTRGVDPLVMKSLNAIQVLELVRVHEPISRARLAAFSRLSKPTVSDQVDALIARGLVVEAGPGVASSRGGKKPTLIRFNGEYGQVFCADIGPEWMRFAAFDLRGRPIHRSSVPTRADKGVRFVVRTLKHGLAELLDASPSGKVRVISLAVPGIIDVRQGVVLETDNVFGWRNLNLGAQISGHFGLPVQIDNDVNMAALAELNGGSAPEDFVLVRLHTGVGAAVVVGGRLHHGAHFAAGEIGHMLLDVRALSGASDPRGYLESVVGQDRVRASIRRLARRNGIHAAEQEAAGEVALHLGTAMANIAAVYDPQAIILLGEAFLPVLDQIRRITTQIVPWPVDIRLSQLGEDAALQGALAAGLSRAYGQITHHLQAEGGGRADAPQKGRTGT